MPEDMDIYMKKIKQRADETDNVMGKIKADKMAELDKLRIDNEMEEVRARLEENRAKIRESQQTGQALAPKQAYNFAELLFAGRPPEEIKQIMDSLDEVALDKLAYLATTMNGQQLGVFTQSLRRPETSVKDTIELINTVVKMSQRPPEQQGITLQGIAALMKEMREAQTPQVPQQSHSEKYLDLLLEELKMARQEQAKDREARLEKEITELKNRPGFVDELLGSAEKYQKAQKIFGANSGGKTEMDLKHEEMQQTERLENRKLDLEEKKYFTEKDNEGKTLETVKDILSGPVGDVLKNIGAAGADRVRGNLPKATSMTQVPCPACGATFLANPNAPKIGCPNCGAQLQRKQAPPPTSPTPSPEQPEPEQHQQPNQVVVTNIEDLNQRKEA